MTEADPAVPRPDGADLPEGVSVRSTTIFHVSDLHFGKPAVPDQIDAIEAMIAREKYDVVAVSGDLSQRARAGEFQRAAVFLRDATRVSRTIVVLGNHDVAWWRAPFGLRHKPLVYENYRRYIAESLEPTLHVDGVTLVGLHTSHGVTLRTLTWNMRDLSIIGDIRPQQMEYARTRFEQAAPGDARVIVMHHNPVRGELSQRHGLKHTEKILAEFAGMGVDVVLCGHDHQEAVHYIEHPTPGMVISTAGTVSNRSRGGRPSSVNVIGVTPRTIEVTTYVWSSEEKAFTPGPHRIFERIRHDQ